VEVDTLSMFPTSEMTVVGMGPSSGNGTGISNGAGGTFGGPGGRLQCAKPGGTLHNFSCRGL
jgi:hypothetical protein